MGNISKSYAHDTAKHKPAPRVRYYKGERRLDRAPLGVVERWVDLQGNVMTLQLRKLSDLPDQGIVDRKRAEKRREGWVEQHECPLTNGAMRSDKIAADFADRPPALREACSKDPKTAIRTGRGVELQDGCPHIQWLIEHRVEKETNRRLTKRGERAASPAEVQAKLLEETRETNKQLVEAVKVIADEKKKPRMVKGAGET